MKRSRGAFYAIFLLLLLVLSSFLINGAKATYGWDNGDGHAMEIHVCDAGSPPHDWELNYVQGASDEIFGVFSSKTVYWWTFLYIGHHQYSYGTPSHYGFFMNGYGQWLGTGSTVPSLWDHNIRSYAQDNHHFVFLWVCRNGNERGNDNSPPALPNGMPNCWTMGLIGPGNGVPISQSGTGSGYENPDGSGYCLISFQDASPLLSYRLDPSRPNQLHKHWLVFFYYWALYNDIDGLNAYRVNEALSIASIYAGYSAGFWQTGLYQGTYTWWPGGDGQEEGSYPSAMRVFGDGNIYLPGNIFIGGPLG